MDAVREVVPSRRTTLALGRLCFALGLIAVLVLEPEAFAANSAIFTP